MSFLSIDDCRRRIIRKNLPELIKRLDPSELLPHLTCISIQAKQRIRCRLENEGQISASDLLLDELPRKDGWWEQFVTALRHPLVGMVDIAELLEAQEESLSETPGKKREKPVHRKEKSKRTEKIDWSTPLSKLPYSVVQVLKKLDVDSKWKDLAAYLGYTVEQVGQYEVYTDKDGSHVPKFYNDLATNQAFNLGQLLGALREIERKDILEDLRHIKELTHLEWNTTGAYSESVSQSPSMSNPLDVTTIARQESCSGESKLCVSMRNSSNISADISSSSNGSHDASLERVDKNTSGVKLGGTQPMSLDTVAGNGGATQPCGYTDNCGERITLNHKSDDLESLVTPEAGHINEYFDNNNYPSRGNTPTFPSEANTSEGSPKTQLKRQQDEGNTAPSGSKLSKTVIGIAATGLVALLVFNWKH